HRRQAPTTLHGAEDLARWRDIGRGPPVRGTEIPPRTRLDHASSRIQIRASADTRKYSGTPSRGRAPRSRCPARRSDSPTTRRRVALPRPAHRAVVALIDATNTAHPENPFPRLPPRD